MKKDEANLKVESVGIKLKKQPACKSGSNVNANRPLKVYGQAAISRAKKGKDYPKTSTHSPLKSDTQNDKGKSCHANSGETTSGKKTEAKKDNTNVSSKYREYTLNKTKGDHHPNNHVNPNGEGHKSTKGNTTHETNSSVKDKTQKRNDPQFIQIKSDDKYLIHLLKKENVQIQSEKCEDDSVKKRKNVTPSSSSQSMEDNSSDDFQCADIIEQFKKKKKRELEDRKKKLIRERKNKLIRNPVYRNAETQVFLDDFTKYYEKVKPQIEKLVEDVLNQALKEIYEDQELSKIISKINHYEQIRQDKYQSLKNYEQNSDMFYEQTQHKIKDRILLKKKVEIIMKKKIAHSKAQKNMHFILQKNLDLYSLMDYFPSGLEKNMNLIVLPWLEDLILYLMRVKKEIVHYIIADMIEKSLLSRTEILEDYKSHLLKKGHEEE
ncbi:Uncharacterized protein PCOAH_00051050 [Plasmodium coatneyi]|uniref:Uncharacterized protein n=1 Tax=Plasmodium coatneyi TaxID=208452 RepID=A0A1B1E6L8_9APIC|nr:Uncharacterized protein PCOAH_00051050 [Plasmodium coatneyi]ANQ10623.1 Uncharacterized protein PCOAH_00051050 [Plasmodium coatneyi]